MTPRFSVASLLLTASLAAPWALANDWQQRVDTSVAQALETTVALRHHFHANPELGNREFKTAEKIAERLRALKFDDVQTGIAYTGVVGILKGGKPGPTVALRADMDGLPVAEKTGLPFASKVTTNWRGRETGVMHACGHDAHMAILLGVAEVLSSMRDDIPGTVKFIFQPAEEGAPEGEEGGADLMVKEGVLDGEFAPGAIFGLHVFPGPTGVVMYRPEGMLAASDGLGVQINGVQTHGSMPWKGIDPITVSAQVINNLQSVVSRQMDLTVAPTVVTIGSINGGNRGNIIPETVTMTGTIRTLDMGMREQVHTRVQRTIEKTAESFGATADVNIASGYPVTYNDPELTERMSPVLDAASNGGKAVVIKPLLGAEDFSYFANRIPGLFIGLGVAKDGSDGSDAAANHSPYFYVNDAALPAGMRALSMLALTWLEDQRGE